MPDVHYITPKLAALYDLDSPWGADREFYLSLSGTSPKDILDLGCGTGLLCNAYAARGHCVVGVDPAPAMLEIARQKAHGGSIEWVLAAAQSYRSAKRFDLIVMTGNAFQALLEDGDIRAALGTMRSHLKPDGIVAFETRNPTIDWPSIWNYDLALGVDGGTVWERRRIIGMEGGRLAFELHYQFPDDTYVSRSVLRFLSCNEVEAHLKGAGLRATAIFGDWDKTPFHEQTSLEMIFMVGFDRGIGGGAA